MVLSILPPHTDLSVATATVLPLPSCANTAPYHHGNLRAALIEAGLELLEDDGFSGLSLRRIAARVGVSHTAPKNHFDSMRALRTALASEGFWRLAKQLKDAINGDAPKRDKLRKAMRAYVTYAHDHPSAFLLMFAPDQTDINDPVLAEAEGAVNLIFAELSEGLNWSRNHPPYGHQRTEWMLRSFAHGYAMLALSDRFLRDEKARPAHDVVKVMPDFEYDE